MNDFFVFSDCWDRIKSTSNISTLTQLADILDISQPTVSRKKSENLFPRNWAIIVGYKSNIHPEWIMTGKGHMNPSEPYQNFNNSFLSDIDIWLTEQIEKEPFRKEWFKGTFYDAFPLFAEWQKSLEQEERKDNSIQNKAA